MSDIITFILPENQYETTFSYNKMLDDEDPSRHESSFDLTSSQKKEPFNTISYDMGEELRLICKDEYTISPDNITIANHGEGVTTIELQTKDAKQSKLIKQNAAKCGFKAK